MPGGDDPDVRAHQPHSAVERGVLGRGSHSKHEKCDKLYEALRDIPDFLKSEAIVPTVIKAPWQARTVNVIKGEDIVGTHKGGE